MRNAVPLMFLATALAACADPAEDDPTLVVGTVEQPTAPPDDTGWPAGDLANFHIAYHINNGNAEVTAVAAAATPGWLNYSQCAVRGVPCLSGIPGDEDEWKDVDLDQAVDRETTVTRFLGFEIEFGPYLMTYQEDPETKFGFYGDQIDIGDLPEDQLVAPTWGGQWQEYKGKDDLFVSQPIEVLKPSPGENMTFTNGETIELEWVPTGHGQVTLLVNDRFNYARFFHFEDDGYQALDVDNDLQISGDLAELTFTFARWNTETLRLYGHVVDLVASSDVGWSAQYYNIGNREPIDPADTCGEASGLPALAPGGYWGWLGNKDASMAASGTCLDPAFQNPGGASASGNEAIVRVEVGSHEQLSVTYNTYEESASVYLLSDCDAVSSCLDGSDLDENDNVPEFASWFNYTDDPQTVFIVLDTSSGGSTVFTVDIDIQPLLEPPMYDTCIEARAAYEILPGTYLGQLHPWVDDLNPGGGGCTGTSLGGADGMGRITVGPDQTLSVSVEMPGEDPGIYLLSDCANAFSCLAGQDASISEIENAAFHNTDPVNPVEVYLILDSKSGVADYVMSVSLSP